MKSLLHKRPARQIFGKIFNSRIIQKAAALNLASRLIALLMLTALLLPLVCFGQSPRVSAHSAPSNLSSLPTPAAALPEVFASVSTDSGFPAVLASVISSSFVSASDKLANDYEAAANFITPPAPPEGFGNAVLPTLGDRAAASFSSLMAPLFAVSPAKNAAVEPEKAAIAAETNASETGMEVEPNTPAALPTPFAQGTTRFDLDGDGKADVARFQSSSNQWKIKNSNGGGIITSTLGTNGSMIAPADYDGDGITDRAVFNQYSADWTIKKSSNASTQTIAAFGLNGDKPVPGDYDGDGLADAALFRPSNGTWYVRRSSDGQFTSTVWGQSGDVPVPGNYDGSGGVEIAVFRPSTGNWYLLLPGNGGTYTYFQWGAGSDIPVPADYDGDGKTDYAVYRPANGTWYIQPISGGTYISKMWGNYGDQPVPADYDGDGKADFAVWRPTAGVWYLVKSSDASYNTYAYDQLGIPNDVAVPSAYVKQIGGAVLAYDLANARLAPKNATGGTDLYSRNFSWGTSLVNLPGRAGLDAGFGISYNSLIWTKESASNTMVFDADHSNVAPGFRFGFPTIEPSYYNGTTQQFSYLMVTPSGGRVEFRQNAASGVYETADSSYAQLTVVAPVGTGSPRQPTAGAEDLTLLVRTTDGTMLTYVWRAGAYRCTEIKDRNGNFISILYDTQYGLLRSLTDTLGRVVTVEYDNDFSPVAIKQDWKAGNGDGATVAHTYATFTYTVKTINPNFAAGINVFGPSGGAYLKVLQQITYPNGGSTTFNYNDYGQVYKVRNVAADSSAHELNSVRTDLETPAANQTDCPRFSTTFNKVENFNNNQETVIHNTFSVNQTYAAGGESLALTDVVEAWLDGDPHQVHSKTYYYAAGNWAEGLPLGTEDIADGSRKRWTRTVWTQDDLTKNYLVNPRVIESKVGDETNLKKTVVEYLPIAQDSPIAKFGLVSKVQIYDGIAGILLKAATTDYNLNAVYVSRHIIGLPSETKSYGLNQQSNLVELVSKATYNYDEGDFSENEQNLSSVIQHDNVNYGGSFTIGRGNPTSTTRHDVTGQTPSVTSSAKYNTAGAAVAQITPGSTAGTTREVKISYADAFNDNISTRNTYAYPTKIIDPANKFSMVKYRFDIGANVWAKSPDLNATTPGKQTSRNYDDKGRLEKQIVINNGGSYARYEYPLSGTQSKVYSTIVDTNNNGADMADEVLAESWTDGAGRVRASRTELPGSTGGYSGSLVEYNVLGQVKRSSVPTEINGSWTPTGDDATRGWLWTSQEYDWKGRVTRTVNTDGTDTLASYDGCGCAGGQITTVQSEVVPRDDQPTTTARRTQKAYADILGRNYKTEALDWNGAVYKTNLEIYNGRDQVITSREVAGGETSSDYRETTMTYDGHGRLQSQHRPEQNTNTATTYTYFADDKPESITDARGASKNYLYNNRGLIEQISWSVPPNSGIEVPTTVTFAYDNMGNRTQMDDGFGSVAYQYNGLSQMTAETRQFNETVPLAPLPNNGFKVEYTYGLSGQLKSYQEPFGEIISYGHDKTGKLKSVSGNRTSENVQLNYVTNAKYRAWGAVKELVYNTNTSAEMNYNNRLQAQDYSLTNSTSQTYQYYSDGRLKFSSRSGKSDFDRSYEYDFLGRLKAAKTGAEARGLTENNPDNRPYRMMLAYNQFGEITDQQRLHWTSSFNSTFQYQNARQTTGTTAHSIPDFVNSSYNTASQFDMDGRKIEGDAGIYKYDAEGRINALPQNDSEWGINHDGDGKKIKSFEGVCEVGTCPNLPVTKDFYIKSSVLGEIVSEVEDSTTEGVTRKTHIYANGNEIAERKTKPDFLQDVTFIQTTDPSGTEKSNFPILASEHYPFERDEGFSMLDAFGAGVGYSNPYPTGTPDPNYPDCDYDFDHDNGGNHCELPDFDDPENEDSEVGSIPKNECYVNGFKGDCNDVANHPEDYESEPEFAPSKKYEKGVLFFGSTNAGVANWVEDADTGSVDLNTNTVNIEAHGHLELEPIDGVLASDNVLDRYENDLNELLKDDLCGKFLKNLTSQVEEIKIPNGGKFEKFNGNIVENFNRIRKGKGFIEVENGPFRANYRDNKIELNKMYFDLPGDTKVGIDVDVRPEVNTYSQTQVAKNADFFITERQNQVFTLVHELIHAYIPPNENGNVAVSHQDMARYALGSLKRIGIKPLITNTTHGNKSSDTFNVALIQACGGVKLGK